MKATPGQKNIKSFYTYLAWMYPLGRKIYPAGFCTLQEVAKAMINIVNKKYPSQVVEVKDIVKLAKV